MIRILIADDEQPARKRLKDLLQKQEDCVVVAEAADGDEVLSAIIGKKPDAAFLDIQMPGASVFDSIPSLKNPPLIVFQTAYSQYAVEAFRIEAVDYLMKPYGEQELLRAVDRLRNRLSRTAEEGESGYLQQISVRTATEIRIVDADSLLRIAFKDGFSLLYLADGSQLYCDRPLTYFEENLDPDVFFRISRTDILRLADIKKLHPLFKGQYLAETASGERVPVSRRRFAELKKRIGL